MTDDTVIKFPEPPKPLPLLEGPFQVWRVVVEGRFIPRLTGYHDGEGRIALVVDNRFSATFAEEDARQAAWLIAQALAIGAGFTHLGGSRGDNTPFAPGAMRFSPGNEDQPA